MDCVRQLHNKKIGMSYSNNGTFFGHSKITPIKNRTV